MKAVEKQTLRVEAELEETSSRAKVMSEHFKNIQAELTQIQVCHALSDSFAHVTDSNPDPLSTGTV